MGRDLYVVLADVDNFRLINDAYGENAGNELLRRIGQTIQAKFGDEHTFRYGSDEFVAVRSFASETEFLSQLYELRTEIAQIDYNGTALNLTCSFGYAYGTLEESDDLHEAIRFADRKMHEAKRQGKDRAVGVPPRATPSCTVTTCMRAPTSRTRRTSSPASPTWCTSATSWPS